MEGSSNEKLPENQFVYRLMTAKCSYGSMSHPLNVAESGGGHGVLYGPEAQPVLNANDWHPGINVIHFGDCTPRFQDRDTGQAVELPGFLKFLGNAIEFCTAKKCSPMIDQVWYKTDEKYVIDGAPVLLVRSMLFCKRGGIITIEVAQADGDDGETVEKTPEQTKADMEQADAEVAASVDQALAEGKIDVETAQFMKDGYSAALQFANGDITTANQLFADLTTGGGDSSYSSSEAQFDKFKLYLQHNDSPLAGTSSGSMELGDSFGGSVGLGDAVASTLAQSQKSAQENEGTDKQAVPIITDMLGHLT